MIPTNLSKLQDVSIDDRHEYSSVRRGRMPGVTRILQSARCSDMQHVPEEALQRGSSIHRTLQLVDERRLSLEAVDDIFVPYVVGWNKFKTEHRFSISMIEQPVGHPLYGYAGTPDRVGTIGRHRSWAVVEIKTGSCPPATGLQLAAYALCLKKSKFLRYAVILEGDNSYKLKEYRNPRDFHVFLAAATVREWLVTDGGFKEDR